MHIFKIYTDLDIILTSRQLYYSEKDNNQKKNVNPNVKSDHLIQLTSRESAEIDTQQQV